MNIELKCLPPLLTEPGVKYFLGQSLKGCNKIREKYYNTMFNVLIFVLFWVILGSILTYKYNGKLSQQQQKQKDIEKQQYIVSKIANLQYEKQKMRQDLITSLPKFNDYNNI